MKNLSIWFHLGFWLVYTGIFTIIEASYKGDYLEALTFELTILPMRLIIVYFNYFVLLPKLILKEKVFQYFFYTLITLIFAGFIQRIINYVAMKIIYGQITSWADCINDPNVDVIDSGIWVPYKFLEASIVIATPLIFFIGFSVIWKVVELQRKTKDLENEKLQSELKYLKSQINPHFLFNTLNNIYGLALDNSKKTPELILKLSDFLSFSIYESNQKMIPLGKEIALMSDFIALEKDRFEDRVNLNVSVPDYYDQVSIPPLILVPFVENAFKHSLKDETGLATIDIKLEVDEQELILIVKNSKPIDVADSTQNKGFGMMNIKKRLDLLYQNNYTLDIQNEINSYSVYLKIKLS